MASYLIATDGKSIICHRCGSISTNPNDIIQLYCGECHTFHQDRAAMRRALRRGPGHKEDES